MGALRKWRGGLLFWILLVAAGAVQAAPTPTFLLLDATDMAAYKAAYKRGGKLETQQVQAVLTQAETALKHELYTIVSKPQLPPSGDKHDFMSQAPYFWPDPSKPNGKPYLQKDGLVNPEAKAMKDDANLAGVCKDVKTLALAYYFSGDVKYATKATQQLRTFFLDPATRMNPNLNYGQGIPGTTEGRSYGIIQTRHLVEIPDALALLAGSLSVNQPLINGLKSWFSAYTEWLTTSKLGKAEGNNVNNHGTFYDVQVVDFALFTGNQALARRILETQTLPRIAVQFDTEGGQPLELARTRPWNYTSMNLQGWVQLAVLARHVGVDLWNYTSPDGRSLRKAVVWLQPYLLREKQLERADVTPTSNQMALTLYQRAAKEYTALNAAQVLALYPDFQAAPWAL
ncbi:alginate lyase family protein [Hymenobacter tibetensis]|uniref:Alginate lyase family protein n=1 Tax=Hymenobacter tibetensis TaxID=497967 RepID=A0ABY4D528_9BACT|nr:alginate lyase family protein [Hymenobacter tibetensis]UOG77094.1 alginate lyase family protein [Hymenobacter tibetensis]